MNENSKNDIYCSICRKEFNSSILRQNKVMKCPNCGTEIKPFLMRFDGYIKINWEEIRILAIYAQRWMDLFDLSNEGNMQAYKVLHGIVEKLKIYKPDGSSDLNHLINETGKEKSIISPYFNGPIRK